MSEIFNDVSKLRDSYFRTGFIAETNIAVFMERVSSKKQEKGNSLKIQDKGGSEYARKANLFIEEIICLAESAHTHEDRKIFLDVIDKIIKSQKTKRKIKHLVLSHASRASRNKKSTNMLRELVLKYGVTIHYFRDNLVLHPESEQEVWDRWEKLHSSSEEDNAERRRNSLDGMLANWEKGIPQQLAPYGYINIIISKDKKGYAFELPYSAYMKRAFELCATGDRDFKKILDQEYIGIIDKKKMPSSKYLLHLLRDVFYSGDFEVSDKGIFKGDPKHLPPLVSKNLWSKVQRVLDDNGRNTRSKRRDLAYTGTIKCGGDILDEDGNPTGEKCGGSVSGEVKREKLIIWGCGNNRDRCSHHSGKYMNSQGLKRSTPNEKIEEMFSEIIQGIKFTDDILEWFQKKVQATVLEQSDFNKNKVASIQANITKKENYRKNFYRDKLSGRTDASTYREIDEELADEIAILKEELKNLESKKHEDDWIQEAIMKKILNLDETFKNAPGHTKNKIILSFCNKIILRHGEMNPEYKSHINASKKELL